MASFLYIIYLQGKCKGDMYKKIEEREYSMHCKGEWRMFPQRLPGVSYAYLQK